MEYFLSEYFILFGRSFYLFLIFSGLTYYIAGFISIIRKKAVESLKWNIIISLIIGFLISLSTVLNNTIARIIYYFVNPVLITLIPAQEIILFCIILLLFLVKDVLSFYYLALKLEKKEALFKKMKWSAYYIFVVIVIQIICIFVFFSSNPYFLNELLSFNSVIFFSSMFFIVLYLLELMFLCWSIYAGIDILKLKK